MMTPKDFEQDFGEEKKMPAEMQEKTPGVYVREENEFPHELDVLWSGSRTYQREDRSPLISFIAGLLVGIVLTAAVFLLLINRPSVETGVSEITAPVSEELKPTEAGAPTKAPATNGTVKSSSHASGAVPKATTYTVKSGDTLGSIAGKVYGSSAPQYVEKIQRANQMKSPDSLQIDQKLVIPPKDY